MEGRIWTFGDNIDTDSIFPTRFGGDPSLEEIAKHAFFDYRPEFAREAEPGDFVVGGYNFGCGSYRETAAICLKALGINVIIARSFSRAFYRNAVNNGLWLITLGDLQFDCADGDVWDVDHVSGTIVDRTREKKISGEPLAGFAVEIVKAGGATKYFLPYVLHPFKGKPEVGKESA